MANIFVDTDWVSEEVLRLLLNKLVVAENFNTSYDKDFTQSFAVGSTVRVKFPQRFLVINGMGYAPQGIDRIYTTVALDQWLQVPFEWDDYERAVFLERSESELRENYWDPAAAALAQSADSMAAQWAYQQASNVVGALGTDPTSVSTYYGARARLEILASQPGKRTACVSSSMMETIGANITTIFNPVDEVSKMFKEGYLGQLGGFNFYESQSLYSHTAGTWNSTVTVTGAGQSGSSLIITGTAGDTIHKGDKISIANVNQVNPMTRRLAGPKFAKNFAVAADYTLTGSADTITLTEPIFGPTSQYANVDALPADGAALTLWPGTTSPNGKIGTVGFALNKFAFAMIAGQLYKPKAVESAGRATDDETGLSIRKVFAWDPVRSVNVHRFDALLGFGNLYNGNNAVCIVGA